MGEIAKWFKSEAGAFAHEVAVRHDKDVRDDEAEHQFRRDMERVTAAFAELGADEHKMRELLRKWFGIDSMEEADFYIEQGAQIEYPVTLLEEYLKREGYEAIDVIRFKKIIMSWRGFGEIHRYSSLPRSSSNSGWSRMNRNLDASVTGRLSVEHRYELAKERGK